MTYPEGHGVLRSTARAITLVPKADPPRLHGPYHQWTRKIDGKTATINLTDDQLERYGPWSTEAQRLRQLLNELEELSVRLATRSEDWGARKSR